jgi:xanthine dehydrogenase molybdopterin-binding subunit B
MSLIMARFLHRDLIIGLDLDQINTQSKTLGRDRVAPRLRMRQRSRRIGARLMNATTAAGRQVGRSLPRLEAREKVTGRAEYTHTMRLPGTLFAKIFRSTLAHGRIKSIDTRAAKSVPGVHSVVTADDIRKVIPDPYYGPAFHDQPILAIDKVRFVGEPVAAVLAFDTHVAEAAGAGDPRGIRGAACALR